MCGIVGFVSLNKDVDYLLNGLQTLEYRGYDSAGVALIDADGGHRIRTIGRVEALKNEVESNGLDGICGIGHTRWATHGAPLERNAHPHADSDEKFFVVHNGIVENYQEIRDRLMAEGVQFHSDTDTEVIPQLIAFHYRTLQDVQAAFLAALKELTGAYAIVMVSPYAPDKLFAARLSSPLVIGIGQGVHYLASDPTALMDYTKEVIFLEDYESAVLWNDGFDIFDIEDQRLERSSETLEYEAERAILGDYPHFMLKEIHEAPQTVRSALLGRLRPDAGLIKLGGLESVATQLDSIDRITIVACGTSYYAGMVGEYLLEDIAGIPVEVELASEYKYRHQPVSRSNALLAISQSGETADTIAALKNVEEYGVLRLGIVNAVGSTISRVTDAGVYCHAGPEQSVASTKAFMAQVSVLTLLALNLNKGRTPRYKEVLDELDRIPHLIEETLKLEGQIKELAEKYSHHQDFLYIGRRYLYPVALEGALKLKELSYIHAEGFAGGEMKHGPLAMIDESFPTFAIALEGEMAEKTISNIQEIRARKGPVLALANAGHGLDGLVDDVLILPKTIEPLQPLLATIPMHLFAYYVAVHLGKNVDRPRNLAKSVTVE